MAVIDSNANLWPRTGIPYVIAAGSQTNSQWIRDNIEAFNKAVGKGILFPLSGNDGDRVEITIPATQSTSGVGRQGETTRLFCKLDQASFFHEIGHLCGLRHENMHPDAPDDVKRADSSMRTAAMFATAGGKGAYQTAEYTPPTVRTLTAYDPASVMLYVTGTKIEKNLTLSQRDIEGIKTLFD